MFRTARAIVYAVVIAVSLLGSASAAVAGEGPVKANAPIKAPLPINRLFDITWE